MRHEIDRSLRSASATRWSATPSRWLRLCSPVTGSVVASTTALVRHNLPHHAWSSGISAFTTVFALGQIVGPSVIGWIADGPGGLQRGLIYSAVALFAGALLASRQRAFAIP